MGKHQSEVEHIHSERLLLKLNFYQEQNSLKRPGGLVEVTNDERYYNAY
jgi:hypothetical protein